MPDDELDDDGEHLVADDAASEVGRFVCPTCGREFSHSGSCPNDGEELLPETELA